MPSELDRYVGDMTRRMGGLTRRYRFDRNTPRSTLHSVMAVCDQLLAGRDRIPQTDINDLCADIGCLVLAYREQVSMFALQRALMNTPPFMYPPTDNLEPYRLTQAEQDLFRRNPMYDNAQYAQMTQSDPVHVGPAPQVNNGELSDSLHRDYENMAVFGLEREIAEARMRGDTERADLLRQELLAELARHARPVPQMVAQQQERQAEELAREQMTRNLVADIQAASDRVQARADAAVAEVTRIVPTRCEPGFDNWMWKK